MFFQLLWHQMLKRDFAVSLPRYIRSAQNESPFFAQGRMYGIQRIGSGNEEELLKSHILPQGKLSVNALFCSGSSTSSKAEDGPHEIRTYFIKSHQE